MSNTNLVKHFRQELGLLFMHLCEKDQRKILKEMMRAAEIIRFTFLKTPSDKRDTFDIVSLKFMMENLVDEYEIQVYVHDWEWDYLKTNYLIYLRELMTVEGTGGSETVVYVKEIAELRGVNIEAFSVDRDGGLSLYTMDGHSLGDEYNYDVFIPEDGL